jgi:hypothetical protein
MSAKSIALAALGLAIFAARAAHAASTSVTLDFENVLQPMSGDYVSLVSGTGTNQVFEGFAKLANVSAGTSTQSVIISPASQSQTDPADINDTTPITGIAFFGVYTTPQDATGLTIGVNATEAGVLEGETYAQLTAGTSAPAESVVVAGLESPPAGDVDIVLGYVGTALGGYSNATIPVGGIGTMVDFSDGTFNGDAMVSEGPTPGGSSGGGTPIVPLPSAETSSLMMLGLLGSVAVTRRRIGPELIVSPPTT